MNLSIFHSRHSSSIHVAATATGDHLDMIHNDEERFHRLVELNVVEQVRD